jgi:hypothetical protein
MLSNRPTQVRKFSLIFTFYKLFAFASLVITLSCLSIIYTWGMETFTMLFWFKIFTLGSIFYYINIYEKHMYSFYKNLGLSKRHLWIPSLSCDLILFLGLLILTLKIR